MTSSIKMRVYRVLATIVILVPVVLNTLFSSDIITSLIYVPLLLMVLTCLAILLDAKLIKLYKSPDKEEVQYNITKVKPAPLKQSNLRRFCHAA